MADTESSNSANSNAEQNPIVHEQNDPIDEPLKKKARTDCETSSLANKVTEKLEHRLGGILSCAVCLDLPLSAIYQCTNGHLMCSGCFTHLLADARLRDEVATCPNCRIEISKHTASRNLAVEKAVNELPAECPYCNQEFPRNILDRHEKELCEDRTVKCKFYRIGCPWSGRYASQMDHEEFCTHPMKSGREVMDILHDYDHSLEKVSEDMSFTGSDSDEGIGRSFLIMGKTSKISSHNRFEHCIGTSFLAGKYGRTLRKNQPELEINDNDILCLYISALCHDIGLGPFSHTWEHFMSRYCTDYSHEDMSIRLLDYMIEENGLQEDFYAEGLFEKDLTFIKECILGHPLPGNKNFVGRESKKWFLYQIIKSLDSGNWKIARLCYNSVIVETQLIKVIRK